MSTQQRIVTTMLERYRPLPKPHMERLALAYDFEHKTFHIGVYSKTDEPLDEGVSYTTDVEPALAYCKDNGWTGSAAWRGFTGWLRALAKHPSKRPSRSGKVTFTGLAPPNADVYSDRRVRICAGPGSTVTLGTGGDDAGL
jgi:hypothetical protein